MKNEPTVALCLIVQNEEEFILSCLKSVKQVVDECIVIDTGSSDETRRLAAEAGATVFNFSWSGDFAEARNFALTQANSDWVLVLDADETLEPVSREAFQDLLSAPAIEGYFVRIKNLVGSGGEATWDEAVRLFRNKQTYRFTGAIHEQVATSILNLNEGQGLAHAPLVILHYGYLDHQIAEKNKFVRNTQILKRELKHNPDDPFLLYCLALEYYQQNEVAEGLACLEKSLLQLHGKEGYFEHTLYSLAWGLLYLGKIEQLIDFITKSLQMFPNQAGLLLLRGIGYLCRSQYQQASQDLDQMLVKADVRTVPHAEAHTRTPVLAYLGLIRAELSVTAKLIEKGFNPDFFPISRRAQELLQDLLVLTAPLLSGPQQ
ncbi:hypothetical protein JCM15765_13640 [Paradesulfitobacterium aromaticivorans]